MLHEEPTKKREQISLVCIDELVPQNHLLRKIDRVIDWSSVQFSFCSGILTDYTIQSCRRGIIFRVIRADVNGGKTWLWQQRTLANDLRKVRHGNSFGY